MPPVADDRPDAPGRRDDLSARDPPADYLPSAGEALAAYTVDELRMFRLLGGPDDETTLIE